MTITIIFLTILICLFTYFILNEKINKIKKEYVKNDLISEMKDIITYFNEEADRNITLLEEKIKIIDNKIKKLEKLKKILNEKDLKNQSILEDTENIVDNDQIIDREKEKVGNLNTLESNNIAKKAIFENWQEQAYRLYTNGFNYEEIAEKLSKNVGEIQFAISYIDMKKRIKPENLNE